MADVLYIANAALDLVGQSQILSIDDNTPAAKKAKLHVYQVVREVLKLGKWKCAKKQAVLAQLAGDDVPAFGWDFAYSMPGDYLRMVLFNGNDPSDPANVVVPEFDIYGLKLMTDKPAVDVSYICDLSSAPNNIGLMDPVLVELCGIKLAQKMAWSFQQAVTLKQALEQEYQLKRRAALASDAQETRNRLVNPTTQSQWLRNRIGSTNG